MGRSAKRAKTYLAEAPGDWDDLRLAVLVNRGTASSAELVAGALQDHDRAVVVGTATYGKGVLQTTYPIGEDVAIKLTTARWYTPSGRTVQRPRADTAGGRRQPASRPAGRGSSTAAAAGSCRTRAASCPTCWSAPCPAPRASACSPPGWATT